MTKKTNKKEYVYKGAKLTEEELEFLDYVVEINNNEDPSQEKIDKVRKCAAECLSKLVGAGLLIIHPSEWKGALLHVDRAIPTSLYESLGNSPEDRLPKYIDKYIEARKNF